MPTREQVVEVIRQKVCGPHQECEAGDPCACRDAADAVLGLFAPIKRPAVEKIVEKMEKKDR